MKIKLSEDEYDRHRIHAVDAMWDAVRTQWHAMDARPQFDVFFEQACKDFQATYCDDHWQ